MLADLQLVETRIERIEASKKITKEMAVEKEVMRKIQEALENEIGLSSLQLSDAEKNILKHLDFLTEKPIVIVVNVDEQQLLGGYENKKAVMEYCQAKGLPLLEICAKVETELSELSEEDRQDFMQDLNIQEPGIKLLAKAIYNRLGLISFLTVGEDEVRAWTLKKDTKAKVAAGKIHSDIERGFIRAETINFQELKECGSMAKARELGRLRLEGKEYVVQDGDIINFRFNV